MLNLRAKYVDNKGNERPVLIIEINRHLLSSPSVTAVTDQGDLFEADIDRFYKVEWPSQIEVAKTS